MEKKVNSPLHCLICSSEVIETRYELKRGRSQNSDKLPIIFILGSILEIPVDKLKYYLGECGSFCDSAIKLCGKCNESVNKTKLIYDEILDAMRRYGEAKEEIIQKLKSSGKASTGRGKKKGVDVKVLVNVTVEGREFVITHDYGGFTFPFQMEKLDELEQLSSASMEEVTEVKTEPMDETNGDDDDHADLVEDTISPKVELEEPEDSDWEGSSESDLGSDEDDDMDEDDDSSSGPTGTMPTNLEETDTFAPKPTSNVIIRRNRGTCHAIDESKSDPGEYICVCGSSFVSMGRLNIHIRYFTEEPKFKCDKCPAKFFTLTKLKPHMVYAHQTKYAKGTSGCIECGAVFTDKEAHKRHRLEHGSRHDPRKTPHGDDKINSSESSFRCLCGKGFDTFGTRLKHIKRHKAVRDYKFKCDMCKSRFRTLANRDAHVEKFHNRRSETREVTDMSCPECGESFKMMKLFQMHMHKIHRKSNWKANQAKVVASSTSKQHGVRPMMTTTPGHGSIANCPRCLCGSAFNTEERLLKHIQRMLPSDPLK